MAIDVAGKTNCITLLKSRASNSQQRQHGLSNGSLRHCSIWQWHYTIQYNKNICTVCSK